MTVYQTIAVADRITVSNGKYAIAVIIDERIEEYIRFKRKCSDFEVFF